MSTLTTHARMFKRDYAELKCIARERKQSIPVVLGDLVSAHRASAPIQETNGRADRDVKPSAPALAGAGALSNDGITDDTAAGAHDAPDSNDQGSAPTKETVPH